ncbi:epoxide hydrolase family protein [Tenggerimyces flavus]|uniref:Epoxide hydrolase family protein n=1 Tax=Tenggerimyces flavus TaxID=1708749 RepID=A0ABV7YBX4_9ACTN|nr:epoxide hydrolase family protein [Tenggerimyces flavus]MBM7788976.1 microsomal epoxide hydrolase [Tenggerimyces flavus]
MTIDNLEQQPIHVPDEVLTDLVRRLLATKWPWDNGNEDSFYGLRREVMQPLVEYWIDGFDWRKAEQRINAYEHYTVDVNGVPVHFMRKPGRGTNPTPLILLHGWPWTFWHWSKVVDQLAADFDVIVPSLPGFGFSTPLPQADMNFWRMADVFHTLMTDVLGHDRYAVGGCDVGALVAGQLGHKYADELYGIHIGSALKLSFFNGNRGWDLSGGNPLPDNLPPEILQRILTVEKRFAVHLAAHVLDPSTLAYGLQDSPAGMLAWILERWSNWSAGELEDAFSKDELLTHAMIYWAGGSIASSIRTYANNNRYPWQPEHDRWPVVEAPTGVTFVGYENPPGVHTTDERVAHFLASDRAAWYHHVNVTAHDEGGHFIPWEIPNEWVADLRRTFRDRV